MEKPPSPPHGFNNPPEPLRCIVIDDEPIALRGMTLLASRHSSLKLEGAFSTPSEALEWVEKNPTDLMFLDIEMPGMKGIELVARLAASQSDSPLIVFTTAYSEYAALSYDLDAADYLLKPISAERFDRAVHKALERMVAKRKELPPKPSMTLTLRADRKFINVDCNSIIYIEGMKDYVKIHTASERIISRITLRALLDLIPADIFLQIHKSFIVNLLYIKAYDMSTIILQPSALTADTIRLPVGASFRNSLMRSISPK